jgi:hypothetical protein
MRDRETIDAELRLLAAVRRTIREIEAFSGCGYTFILTISSPIASTAALRAWSSSVRATP